MRRGRSRGTRSLRSKLDDRGRSLLSPRGDADRGRSLLSPRGDADRGRSLRSKLDDRGRSLLTPRELVALPPRLDVVEFEVRLAGRPELPPLRRGLGTLTIAAPFP